MPSRLNIANVLSLLRIAITPIVVWIFLYRPDWLIPAIVLFTIAALSDTCDGYIARRYGLVTELGNFLDPLADKILVFSTFFVFYMRGFVPLWFVILVITRESLITLLRCVLVNRAKPLQTSWLGKWKTTIQIMLIYSVFLMMLVQGSAASLMITVRYTVDVLMYVAAFITGFSGFNYVMRMLRI